MKLKSESKSLAARLLRAGLVGLASVGVLAGSATGCLDRPVSPAQPNVTNVFVDQIRQETVDKIDILFMIDNSISMADKQAILAKAVPQLLQRLIVPLTDPTTGEPEFKPVENIHIGVITSSLGGHGADICAEGGPNYNATQVDNARLLGSVRPSLAQFQGKGFLWWDPAGKFGGETNAATLQTDFATHVTAAGEQGCGYEATLEAWYRFLIDPNPPEKVINNNGTAEITAPDPVVLQQRADFLRPDSLVAVVMLSDENDCSIADGGQSWIVGQQVLNNDEWHLPRATTACQTDPDSECCRSCKSTGATPAGCTPIDQDTECQQNGGFYDKVSGGDHVNLRCFNQRKRFGINFLYPTQRYVDGLTKQQICPVWDANGPAPDCATVPNPLYSGAVSRDKGLVFLAGIVGVPWQDIATDDSLSGAGLTYLTAQQLNEMGRWGWLLPNGSNDVPDDPLMIESIQPRTGTNPATNAALADPNASSPTANIVNGHEWNILDNGDLQYACIFPLDQTRDCGTVTGSGCDCKNVPTTGYTGNNPLCQNPSTGAYSKVQHYAKGYPGIRELQVLKDFGENAIVASICPKLTSGNETDPSFGYNPAVNAIIEQLKKALTGKCVNRPLAVNPTTGGAQCKVVEVTLNTAGCAACPLDTNRVEVYGNAELNDLIKPVLKQLEATGQCGAASAQQTPCTQESFCMCAINEESSGQCLTAVNPQGVYGWCYIDGEKVPPVGDPNLVPAECNPKRLLRFVGDNTPASGAIAFIACLGANVSGPDPTGAAGAAP